MLAGFVVWASPGLPEARRPRPRRDRRLGGRRAHRAAAERRGARSAPLAKIDDVTITLGELQERINRQSPYIRARYTSLEQKKEFLDSLVRFEVLAKEAARRGLDQRSRGRPHDEAGDDPEADARRVRREGHRRHGVGRRDEGVLRRQPRRVRQARGGPGLGDHPQEQGAGRPRRASRRAATPARPTRGSATWSTKYSQPTRTPSSAAATCATSTRPPRRSRRRSSRRAFGLVNTGDVSGVVDAGNGTYYVLKQTGRRKSMTKSFDDAKPAIRNKLFREKRVAGAEGLRRQAARRGRRSRSTRPTSPRSGSTPRRRSTTATATTCRRRRSGRCPATRPADRHPRPGCHGLRSTAS